MKAIICEQYGDPADLIYGDTEKPSPSENEVLVKIYATAVNDYDWSSVRGKPNLYRLLFGILKPKSKIPGMELAGIVEEVGANVSSFRKGDRVYGDTSEFGFGSFAEFMSVNEAALTIMPDEMSFQEAASLPHASILALQGLKDKGGIKKGQRILINGGGGGVGTFGLQIAKQYDAEVTGVDTGEKLQMMKDLGFDHIIDYKEEDFTKNGEHYDLILDAKTNRSPFSYLRSLSIGGTYVTVGGILSKLLLIVVLGPILSKFTWKNLKLLPLEPNKGLDYINELYSEKKLKCIIDGPYPLQETPTAIQYFGDGLHSGKVVISVCAD
jgi:NADPH:quinone reductase-like Zn-dependent oxidoreductase